MTVTTMHDGRVVLHQADCRDVLRGLADNSIDSVVTDPPYALVSIQKRFGKPGSAPVKVDDVNASGDLKAAYARASAGFMGKQWDTGEVAFSEEFWAEVLRVLKPGGHVVAFSGTRTYHRMAVAIEDAGFEIRDQLGWVYGSGFPKSHDVQKAIQKAKGRAGKDDEGNPIWCESCGKAHATHNPLGQALLCGDCAASEWEGWGSALKPAWEPICLARKPLIGTIAENVLAYGVGGMNINDCRVEGVKDVPASPRRAEQGAAYGDLSNDSGTGSGWDPNVGRWPANIVHDGSEEVLAAFPADGDKSAARFFYCAKASRADRDAGLGAFPLKPSLKFDPTSAMARDGNRGSGVAKNTHPTVKPTDLMRWLCRLVTPPGGVILDPFMGSGSTGKAALIEGFRFIGCEREDEYMPIAEARIAAALRPVAKPNRAANDNAPQQQQQADLFTEAS